MVMSNNNIPKARPYTDEEKKLLEMIPVRIQIRESIRQEEGDQVADDWYYGEDG
jgi:hypothetical protein